MESQGEPEFEEITVRYQPQCLRVAGAKNVYAACIALRVYPSPWRSVREASTGRKIPRVMVFGKTCSRRSNDHEYACIDRAIEELRIRIEAHKSTPRDDANQE